MTSRAARAGLRVLAIFGALVAAPGGMPGLVAPAWAQSKRYPPEPADKDAERAGKSNLWTAAITPERHPYQDLVLAAAIALSRRTDDQTRLAIKKLDEAIQLLPHEPEAYRLRGDAFLEQRAWAKCAADFAAAEAASPRHDDEPPKAITELHRKLGLCQAHAGKLASAEQTLAEAVASGNAPGELWMRLGEVRIAMGKLDEAIGALKAAISATDPPSQAMIHFMLAAAYDRARRPADALVEANEGLSLDSQLSILHNPVLPPLTAGELDYMLGLAYSAKPQQPEHVIAYFRTFVQVAPDSPWRRRAEEHLREIKASELPGKIKPIGTAPLDADAARATARRAMPQLRACLARFPAVVVEVEISRAGPRTPTTDRMRPRFFSPPDGVTVHREVGELSNDELDAIDSCLSPLATRLALPPVKEHDAYYKARFYVVGP